MKNRKAKKVNKMMVIVAVAAAAATTLTLKMDFLC